VLVRFFYASSERLPKELHNPAAAAAAQKDLQGLLGLLNDRFEKRQYLLGASYSLADLIVACTINYAKTLGIPTQSHPALEGWLQRCLSRPALQSPWE
jgi:glutathione S-transferase